jgi:hypothetical protein
VNKVIAEYLKVCECGGALIETNDEVAISNLYCSSCDTTKAIVYSLPSRIQRASTMLEGKELCEKVISILVEYGYVQQIKQLP